MGRLSDIFLRLAEKYAGPDPFQEQGVLVGEGLRCRGVPIIRRHAGSRIVIGDEVTILNSPLYNPLIIRQTVIATICEGAEIVIGNKCGISGATIVSALSIVIGNYVGLGGNCTIIDSDFHPVDPALRGAEPQNEMALTAPVIIGDNVWIGTNAIILKGVTIGEGSVVAANSCVTKDVEPYALVAGNPARFVRRL